EPERLARARSAVGHDVRGRRPHQLDLRFLLRVEPEHYRMDASSDVMFTCTGPPSSPVSSFLSARPRSRAMMFALSRSAAAPANFCERITSSILAQISEKSGFARYSVQFCKEMSRNRQRPETVIARIFGRLATVTFP